MKSAEPTRAHVRRIALLFVVLVLPTAWAAPWTLEVDAPRVAAADAPLLARACAIVEPGERVQIKAEITDAAGATVAFSQDGSRIARGRYGAPVQADELGRACRELQAVAVAPGSASLVVKARAEGAGAARADAALTVDVRAARFALLAVDGAASLLLDDGARIPLVVREGRALVPLVDGARGVVVDGVLRPLPQASPWRIVEAHAGAGIVLQNLGGVATSTEGLSLRVGDASVELPGLDAAPGARVLVGLRGRPVADAHILAELPVKGEVDLRLMDARIDAVDVPPLAPGFAWARASGVVRAGATSLAPEPRAVAGELVAYATPVAGAAPLVDLLDGARREILVELYTLTSEDVAAALARAALRGVRVDLLLEGAPVGGIPAEEARLVSGLVAAGARVSFLASAPDFPARYRTLHAKLFVVDGEWAHVSTDNPTPGAYPATPGAGSSRGASLLLRNASLASSLVALHAADAAPWPDVRPADPAALPPPEPLRARPLERAPGAALRIQGAWNVTPILSPDASSALAERVRNATRRVDVALLFLEPRFRDGGNPLVEALVDAARDGAEVRVLLDGRAAEGNAATVEILRAIAEREGLALDARLASRDATLHAKLLILDERETYVGSMNGGRASMQDNREVGLLVENETLAAWYGERYEEWWVGEKETRREAPESGWSGVAGLAVAAVLSLRSRPRIPRRGRGPP